MREGIASDVASVPDEPKMKEDNEINVEAAKEGATVGGVGMDTGVIGASNMKARLRRPHRTYTLWC